MKRDGTVNHIDKNKHYGISKFKADKLAAMDFFTCSSINEILNKWKQFQPLHHSKFGRAKLQLIHRKRKKKNLYPLSLCNLQKYNAIISNNFLTSQLSKVIYTSSGGGAATWPVGVATWVVGFAGVAEGSAACAGPGAIVTCNPLCCPACSMKATSAAVSAAASCVEEKTKNKHPKNNKHKLKIKTNELTTCYSF